MNTAPSAAPEFILKQLEPLLDSHLTKYQRAINSLTENNNWQRAFESQYQNHLRHHLYPTHVYNKFTFSYFPTEGCYYPSSHRGLRVFEIIFPVKSNDKEHHKRIYKDY